MFYTNILGRFRKGLLLWTEMLQTLKTFPRPVWILLFGTFINKFGSFVMPFLALYMTGKGYTKAQAGLALGSYGIGHFLACIIGGHLADTIGRRKTIVISMFAGGTTMALLSQAQSFPTIILFSGLVGLTSELYRPASSALLADLVPPSQRVAAFAGYRLAFNAGFAFGPATAGLMAQHSMIWLFLGDALTSILFGLVVWFALPELVTREKPIGWKVAYNVMLRDSRLLKTLSASLLIGLIFHQMGSTYGLQVTLAGLPTTVYGLLLSLNGALVALFELPLTALTQPFSARKTMAAGFLLIGVGFALNGIASSLAILASSVLIFTIGEMISMPRNSAYVAGLAPTDLRGRYMGAYGFTWALALIFGPGLGMMLFEHSPMQLWLTCGILGTAAAMLVLSQKEREVF